MSAFASNGAPDMVEIENSVAVRLLECLDAEISRVALNFTA